MTSEMSISWRKSLSTVVVVWHTIATDMFAHFVQWFLWIEMAINFNYVSLTLEDRIQKTFTYFASNEPNQKTHSLFWHFVCLLCRRFTVTHCHHCHRVVHSLTHAMGATSVFADRVIKRFMNFRFAFPFLSFHMFSFNILFSIHAFFFTFFWQLQALIAAFFIQQIW